MGGNGGMVVQAGGHKTNNLITRLLSAIVMIPPVIGIIYLGAPYFHILVILGFIILIREWVKLCSSNILWSIFGISYFLLCSIALIQIRSITGEGYEIILSLFIIVWASDSGAFVFGKVLGGAKLAPKTSPNKTWSGFIGGVLCGGSTGIIIGLLLKSNILLIASVSVLIGVISQLGDLLESRLKRLFGKKDSGTLIPGHGGLLDRVDGLLAAGLFLWILTILFPSNIFYK